MKQQYPLIVTAGAIQETIFAALRVLGVLIGGGTAVLGFVGKRDLAGLTAYVQSSDFTAVAGAIAAIVSLGYGMWRTYRRKQALVMIADTVPDAVATVVKKPSDGSTIASMVLLTLTPFFLMGCATVGNDVRLNANKAFLTAQIAFKSTQQTTLAVCSVPAPRLVEPCEKAIDLLHSGAQAEAAGFTAQQAGNAADLQTAITTLTNLPAQLVGLGVLEAN